jgi:hypothetical protein
VISALVNLFRWLLDRVEGRRKREAEEAERKEAERARREADEAERQKFLAGFGEVTFEHDPDAVRRFVWRYPAKWRDEVPEETALKPLDDEETFWLNFGIWHSVPDLVPSSCDPRIETSPQRLLPYETDRERGYKRRVLVQSTGSIRYAVGLVPRKGEMSPAFCIPCRIAVSVGGNFCRKCSRPVHELRRAQEAELRDYRDKRDR